MDALGFAVVATSANRRGAPLCFDNAEAFRELSGLADGFLLHDRAILRPVEDGVVHVFEHEALRLRLGRGDVPVTWPSRARPSRYWARAGSGRTHSPSRSRIAW